jgi:hypothetical protein
MRSRHALAALSQRRFISTVAGCADLISKNLEARGGAAAIDGIKSIRFDGRIIFPGDFSSNIRKRARIGTVDASRVDATLQGLDAVKPMTWRAWINSVPGPQGRRKCRP